MIAVAPGRRTAPPREIAAITDENRARTSLSDFAPHRDPF